MNPSLSTLDGLLADIYNRYIALDETEFQEYYNLTLCIVKHLLGKMKAADPYFNRHCSTVEFAGSHYDRLRINKPDEFDIDIIITLPVNMQANPRNPEKSDIVLEPQSPGYVQLKMGEQFQNLPYRDDWNINKTAYDWLDNSNNYLLRSKFTDWFKSVVDKALNRYSMYERGVAVISVNGLDHTMRLSSSGPAITLIIENRNGWHWFKLNVDLVPVLKFPESRWPICRGYREIPPRCKKDIWMVVPKGKKTGLNQSDAERSWRLTLHLQERELMYDSNNLRQGIRLVKKLRDSLEMHKISSYCIKTLFYLEAAEYHDASNWGRNSPATIFTRIVIKLYQALKEGNIPEFWHKDNNLIGHVDRSTLTGYANRLHKLVEVLQNPTQYKLVANFLLPTSDFQVYNRMYLHI